MAEQGQTVFLKDTETIVDKEGLRIALEEIALFRQILANEFIKIRDQRGGWYLGVWMTPEGIIKARRNNVKTITEEKEGFANLAAAYAWATEYRLNSDGTTGA